MDLPFLKDVQAEDIEAFDQRHHFFDSVELNSDTVKKVRLKNAEAGELFIALIEHKSSPDYDFGTGRRTAEIEKAWVKFPCKARNQSVYW